MAAFLTACSDGGGSSAAVSPDPATTSPTISARADSGVIPGTGTSAVDSDSNDPNQSLLADDGVFETSQSLPNPVHLTGYLALPGEGRAGPASITGDLIDGYRLFLNQGQVVELELAGDPSRFDIDLFVYDEHRNLRGRSVGLDRYECVRITSSGEYFLGAEVFAEASEGGSIYHMRIGALGSWADCPNATGAADLLIPNEIVANPSAEARRRLAVAPKSLDGIVTLKGDPTRQEPLLLQMPAGHSAREEVGARLRKAVRSGIGGLPGALPFEARRQSVEALLDAWHRGMPARSAAIRRTVHDAKLLVASGDYLHAVPNFRVDALQTLDLGPFPPDDREYVRQRWHYEAINLPEAVSALQGVDLSSSAPPLVAVVDTGVVATHPDLADQIVAGYDFVSEAAIAGDGDGIDADPDDASRTQGFPFHGTHVAGTIAAQTYNGIGGAGVAPISRIMPVRVLGTSGSGTLYDIIQGVRFAAGMPTDAGFVPSRRADVINLSLGAEGMPCEPMLQELFKEVRDRGALVVAAAGNSSRPDRPMPVSVPANCPNVFSVAATDALNRRARYSNTGPENFIAAPGGDLSQSTTGSGLPDGIYSATASIDGTGERLPSYGYLEGTSMAAPHVAGVFALMRWANSSLTPQDIEELVRNGSIVDDIGLPGRDVEFGYGLVNARKAVDAALGLRGVNFRLGP